MTELVELKAEADAAREGAKAARIAWKKAHAEAATAVYSDASYSNYEHAAYEANAAYKAYADAYDAAEIYCDAAAYAVYTTNKVYQAKRERNR